MPKQSFKDNESRIEISTSMTLSYDLHDPIDIFLKSRLTTLEKGIHCSCKSLLRVAISGCCLQWFKKISAIDTKSRVELYVVQSLYTQKSYESDCKEGVLHTTSCLKPVSKHYCNTFSKKIASIV